MCAIIAVGIPYGSMVLQGTRLGLSSCTPAAFFLLFVLLITVQIALGAVRRSWALSRAELVTVFVMMAVATAIPTRGVTGMLLPMITGTFYFNTPENNWADLIHPLLSDWMVVRDVTAVKQFYEGSGGSAAIPWDIWVPPLFRWFSFYAGFWLTLVCIMVILRRPWVEHERLVFPLAQLPLAMIDDGDGAPIVKPFFKNPVMWCGLAIPLFLNSINALSFYYQFITPINPVATVDLFRHSVILSLRVNYLMFGFAYFISSNISFSLWFFYLIHMVQVGIFSVVGIHSSEELGPWTGSGPVGAIMGHQMMGSLIVLVLFGLWTARGHLRQVVLKAIGRAPQVDDSEEILSYRTAARLWLGCAVFVFGWLVATGLPPLSTAVFLIGAFVIFLAIARVIAQGGVGFTSSTMLPQPFTVYTLGSEAVGWKGLASLSMSYSWAAEMRTTVMASAANAVKLTDGRQLRHTRLFWTMALAVLLGMAAATWTTLHLNYAHGGINLRQFGVPAIAWRFLEDKLRNPIGWEHIEPRLVFVAIGAAMMAGLIWLQHHFLWWPLHYIGLPVGDSWVMGWAWFSVFLGWLAKGVVFRFTGSSGYLTAKPLFLGFIAGQLMGGAVWMVVDAVLGEVGNIVYIGVR